MNVIFNRPVRIGYHNKDEKSKKVKKPMLFPASARSVVVPDEFQDDWFFQQLVEDGHAVVVAKPVDPKAPKGAKKVIAEQAEEDEADEADAKPAAKSKKA